MTRYRLKSIRRVFSNLELKQNFYESGELKVISTIQILNVYPSMNLKGYTECFYPKKIWSLLSTGPYSKVVMKRNKTWETSYQYALFDLEGC